MLVDFWEKVGVLRFSGPDAVRFLNGQVTQDVRLVSPESPPLPACVTDAKAKLMFRVWLASEVEDEILVFCPKASRENLEARLTRYLIADDVEVADVSHETDLEKFDFPNAKISEAERIERGIPKWGAELQEGMLPPEANLDKTDISYTKGCYVGQEVISRIKSAGKVNRYLTKFRITKNTAPGEIETNQGKTVGKLTSVAGEYGLGFLKRSFDRSQAIFVNGNQLQITE